MDFKLTSKYKPTGDQPEAIKELTEGLKRGDKSQVLLGVTGSGKTFTMANVTSPPLFYRTTRLWLPNSLRK